jgi:uroporphyrin-III C-methyltransferase/precorrin-2 dehydrogenase/sirohydrochlorin ferrochelatase
VAQQAEAQLPAPSLVIVGEVVALQPHLSWFGEAEVENESRV